MSADRRRNGDQGSAMILVMGLTAILTLFATVFLASAMRAQANAATVQYRAAAQDAANAGIEDYKYRVNRDATYLQWGNTQNDCFGAVATIPDAANNAMKGIQVTIPGGATPGAYTYTADMSRLCRNGTITVTATGYYLGKTRQVAALLRRRGFLDYAYFSDYEVQDPADYTTNPFQASGDTIKNQCGRHYYEPAATTPFTAPPRIDQSNATPATAPACVAVSWGDKDEVRGPIHSNDAHLICGAPGFSNGDVTTSWKGVGVFSSTNQKWRPNTACNNAPFFIGNTESRTCGGSNNPCYRPQIVLPKASKSLFNYALFNTPADTSTASYGCTYIGPTVIRLHGNTSGVGQMDVVSPLTPLVGQNAACGPGLNLNVPMSGIVYVMDAPSTARAPCTTPAGNLSPVNAVGFPIPTDITQYGCADGDVFLERPTTQASGPMLTGAPLTIAAEGRVIVKDSIDYTNRASTRTLTGLIGARGVEVYNPVAKCTILSSTCVASPDGNSYQALYPTGNLSAKYGAVGTGPGILIAASVMAVDHSFKVQNYDKGVYRGTVTVFGAVIQKYRGPVGTADLVHGYKKLYINDPELQTDSPPYFLDPLASEFRVVKTSQPSQDARP